MSSLIAPNKENDKLIYAEKNFGQMCVMDRVGFMCIVPWFYPAPLNYLGSIIMELDKICSNCYKRDCQGQLM